MTWAAVGLGVLAWSLYHYWGHRLWHLWMHHGKRNALLEQEIQHHLHYDEPTHPDEAHLAFPWSLWALTGAMVLAAMVAGGLTFGLLFGLGAFGGMVFDDQLHRRMHRGSLRWDWFMRWHQAHHRTHTGNFSMATGVMWDRVFGTHHKEQ